MFSLFKRILFRKKLNIDWSSFVVQVSDKEKNQWIVTDAGNCVFKGTENECYEFIEAFKKIVKKFG